MSSSIITREEIASSASDLLASAGVPLVDRYRASAAYLVGMLACHAKTERFFEQHARALLEAPAPASAVAGNVNAWHGPVEGFIVSDGPLAGEGLTTTPNGIHSAASWRMERRAREMRDIGTLRFLAREYDRAGGTNAAEHARKLAGNCVYHAAVDAYCAMPAEMRTSDRDAVGFVGPVVREAYDSRTDLFVGVLAYDQYAVTVRCPYAGTRIASLSDLTLI